MAKPLRGECEVELAGKKYAARLGLGELEELDDVTGLGTIALGKSLSGPDAKISLARAVLEQGLRGDDGKKLNKFAVRGIIESAQFEETISAAIAMLTSVLVERKPGNAQAPATTTETPTGA